MVWMTPPPSAVPLTLLLCAQASAYATLIFSSPFVFTCASASNALNDIPLAATARCLPFLWSETTLLPNVISGNGIESLSDALQRIQIVKRVFLALTRSHLLADLARIQNGLLACPNFPIVDTNAARGSFLPDILHLCKVTLVVDLRRRGQETEGSLQL